MNVTLFLPPDQRANSIKGPFFEALRVSAAAKGVRARWVDRLTDRDDTIIGWGYGAWWRSPEVQASGRFILFDLGYFHRDAADNPLRCAFGKMHNPELVARDWPADRWNALGIPLRNDWNPNGPIILVGQGRKSCVMYGEDLGAWETQRLIDIKAAYPGRRVWFRAKPGRGHTAQLSRLSNANGSIEEALRGASLVVCRHSNVALDALIAGVPVVCNDGLAAAVCPKKLPVRPQPVREADRLRVLRCAAWLQWTRAEARAGAFWRFLRTMA